jgi:hypothetical protein
VGLRDIIPLANEIYDWEEVFTELGLPRTTINEIIRDHKTKRDRCKAALREWQYRQGSSATFGRLIGALEVLGAKGNAQSIGKIAESSTVAFDTCID